MSGIKAKLIVLLSVMLAVVNAQCLTVCALKPCSNAQAAVSSVQSNKAPSCPHEGAPKQPSHESHNEEGCSHQLLRVSASQGAKSPFQTLTPAVSLEPVPVDSCAWISSAALSIIRPTLPPNRGIFSITVLRI